MSTRSCPEHAELVALIRGGSGRKDIQGHIDGCEECRKAARAIHLLAPLAAPSRQLPPVADVYWHARAQEVLGASNRRTWRVVRPLRFFNLGVGVALIATALLTATGPLIGLFGFGELVVAGPVAAFMAAVGTHLLISGTGTPKDRAA